MPMLADSTRSRRNTWRSARVLEAIRGVSMRLLLWWRGGAPGGPLQMLPAIQRQHLSGHRRQGQDGDDGAADLLRARAVAQRHRLGLAVELRLGLALAGQRRTGADGVDPDARR